VTTDRRNAPFLNFVLALAHSNQSFDEFVGGASEAEIIKTWGITPEQLAAVRDGNLPLVQSYVEKELGTEAAVVATIWIGKVPWPWVGTS
jgi:hypothetical protein